MFVYKTYHFEGNFFFVQFLPGSFQFYQHVLLFSLKKMIIYFKQNFVLKYEGSKFFYV
jgi:hypothetical protein